MKTVITRLIIAVILASAAWLSWREAKLTARVASAKERLATLDLQVDDDLDAGTSLSDFLPIDAQPLSTDIRRTRTTVEYWLAQYDEVMAEANGDLDAEVLLAAANAAFRAHEREGGAGPAQVQRLDGVLQAYVAVLKAETPPTLESPRKGALHRREWMRRTTTNTCRGCAIRWPAAAASPERKRRGPLPRLASRAICRPAPPCMGAPAVRRPT